MSAPAATGAVMRALAAGAWREQPGRLVLAVLGIAFGVALGVAVHLINASAANEFDLAIRSLSGEADLVVRGARSGFSDALYPRIAKLDGVRAASPALELDAQLAGRRETIKIVGIDPFRAGEVQPHLLSESRSSILELLKGDGVPPSRRPSACSACLLPVPRRSASRSWTLRVHSGISAGSAISTASI